MAEWFAPKRNGYGAGLPITWQGWALFIAYIVLMSASSVLAVRYSVAVMTISLIGLTMIFLLVVKRTTRGGWRWRTGKGE